ncbi:hypothetical protein N474_01050 [Pseudoalteromonas luteoviolacea CPMOR-2]|uniref:SnoaL-like domain-containing protein n=1 Tax=Pseudoalteromonas luteoviolacea DSM 6061 TaxID=1365250 RepID=A0A166XM60_9GAMM|nr:nuclear transport factor 2 family protein [Pseudoalteromonas luteoviolacea]KZN40561.1 hypothetical protein N475_11455 [Pseudoalteromonas luteoviolacea DSM 6061]KZN55551.1 hypothetical protein N474_01050 [Pseudoalteromonas luteoviolacea CPMOR-2]MBE0389652.1 hypothetical protein [Pseudoalteromonas luteoviolacea DSM 6061]
MGFILSLECVEKVDFEVRESFGDLIEASKALDLESYFKCFDADRFVGLNANGTNWNSIEDLKSFICPIFGMIEKVQSLDFTNITVSVIDTNTAILVNEYEQSVVLKSGDVAKASGGGTQVWSKACGNWKLVSVSASTKPENPNDLSE